MGVVESGLLAANPWVTRRAINVDEYYRMAKSGLFAEGDRVELIEGALIAMTPIGDDHVGTVEVLTYHLVTAIRKRGIVSVQNPLRLDDATEPEPDFVVYKPRADFYRKNRRGVEDVLLVIEVADSSVDYDKKVKVPLYAKHGIAEYWLVRLDTRVVEVHRGPGPNGYASMHEIRAGQDLELLLLPGITIPAATVLRAP